MMNSSLIDRLAALPTLREMPRDELAWLVEHGDLQNHEPGAVVSRKGERLEQLFLILAGRISVYRDQSTGPRLVMGWGAGDVTGMLPYSRLKAAAGTGVVEEPTELLAVHVRDFPEMVIRCPTFTAHTVHLMIDRARSFNASDLRDEKMVSLGRLAAGLAHELNNPASAAIRGAKLLMESLAETEAAARDLGSADLTPDQLASISAVRAACKTKPGGDVLSPLAQARREDTIAGWLARHEQDERCAVPLAETAVTLEELDALAGSVPRGALGTVLRWLAAGCTTHALAQDIEHASSRIHELVGAVKRFTYMDKLSADASTKVEPGLRDTARVVASKARAKGTSIELVIEPDLPPVPASGGELNQVWLNLIDNALDAVPESGHVRIEARRVRDRVVVSVIDDGPGIPHDVMPKIFDPFFTTKAPGQGTGLGLELTRRIVRTYRGDLAVESRPGKTEFRVSLAVHDNART
jgi:signal transduction histidine kinase